MFATKSFLFAVIVVLGCAIASTSAGSAAGASASAMSSSGGGDRYYGNNGNTVDYDYVEEVSGSYNVDNSYNSRGIYLVAAAVAVLAFAFAGAGFGLIGALPTGVFGNGPAPWSTTVLTGLVITSLVLLFLGLVAGVVVFAISFVNY